MALLLFLVLPLLVFTHVLCGCQAPSVAVDYLMYKKAVVAIFNIIFYNVLNPNGLGPELYGVEPWTYYFINGFLNFNIVMPLSLAALPVLLLFRKWSVATAHLSLFQVFIYALPL